MQFLSDIKGALNLGNDHEDYIAYTKQNKLRFLCTLMSPEKIYKFFVVT